MLYANVDAASLPRCLATKAVAKPNAAEMPRIRWRLMPFDKTTSASAFGPTKFFGAHGGLRFASSTLHVIGIVDGRHSINGNTGKRRYG